MQFSSHPLATQKCLNFFLALLWQSFTNPRKEIWKQVNQPARIGHLEVRRGARSTPGTVFSSLSQSISLKLFLLNVSFLSNLRMWECRCRLKLSTVKVFSKWSNISGTTNCICFCTLWRPRTAPNKWELENVELADSKIQIQDFSLSIPAVKWIGVEVQTE